MNLIKKSVLYTLMYLGIALHTNANNPFVEWPSGKPTLTGTDDQRLQTVHDYLITVMNGQKPTNSNPIAKPANYIAVWTQKGFDVVLNAPITDFRPAQAKGDEINFGIDANGNTVQSPNLLKAGTFILEFRINGVWLPLVKWGENGCLNPISRGTKQQPSGRTDPDEQLPNTPGYTGGGLFNYQPININTGGTASKEVSWLEGYGIYSQGRNDRTLDMFQDLSVFKELNTLNAAGGGSTIGATNVSYILPAAGASNAQVGGGDTYINQAPMERSWAFYASANAAGTFVGGLAKDFVESLFARNRQQVRYRNGGGTRYYTNGNGQIVQTDNVAWSGGTDLGSAGMLPHNLFDNGTGAINPIRYSNDATAGRGIRYTTTGGLGGLFDNGTGQRLARSNVGFSALRVR